MPKRRRRIVVPMIRWGFAAASAVFLLVWAASGWFRLAVDGEPAPTNRRPSWECKIDGFYMHLDKGMLTFLNFSSKIDRWTLACTRSRTYPQFSNDWLFKVASPKLDGMCAFPLWAPALLFSLPAAALWTTHIRATRRSRTHACPKCGYDLRGLHGPNPTCPECGPTPVDSKP